MEFTLNDTGNGYAVTGYTGAAREVEIPSIHKGLPVVVIGDKAFASCNGEWGSAITSVKIPDSVISIGANAFVECTSLMVIEIPNSVEVILDSAFSSCNCLTIYSEAEEKPTGWSSSWNRENCPVVWEYKDNDVANDGHIYTIVDGVRYALKDGEAKVARQARIIRTANIPESISYKETEYIVTQMVAYAFMYSAVNSVDMADTMLFISQYAFYYCAALTDIRISSNATAIGEKAFYECRSLTNIEIPDSVTWIGYQAFYFSGLQTIILGENSQLFTVEADAFRGCTIASVHIKNLKAWCNIEFGNSAAMPLFNNFKPGANLYVNDELLTELVIPEGTTNIKAWVFFNCETITSLSIPNSVTAIGENAFARCKNLNEVYITDIDAWCNIDFGNENATPLSCEADFYVNNELLTELAISKKLKAYALAFCRSLTSVTISEGITKIESYAFYRCNQLTSVTIPNSLTSIGDYAFNYCSSLTSIEFSNKLKTIGAHSFEGCHSLENVTIPQGVQIKGYAFANCRNFTEIVLPSNTGLGEYAFSGCQSLTIYCDKSKPTQINANWYSGCPVVWNCDYNDVASDGYIYVLEDGVRYALKDGKAKVARQPLGLSEANIPESISYKGTEYIVTTIGAYAFNACTNLTSVVIGSGVTTIDSMAFEYCDSLTDVYYKGTESDWANVSMVDTEYNSLRTATVYYYVENEADVPTDDGNYWHYDENGEIAVW